MRKTLVAALAGAGLLALVLAVALRGPGPQTGTASSHREAPLTAEDPTADNTDLYAFRSPDKPDTLTIISNWIPAEDPAAGPLYYAFSSTARYNVYVDRNGNGKPDGNDVTFRVRFGPARTAAFLRDGSQPYTVTRNGVVVARGVTPPNNIGPRSTPNYRALAAKAVYPLKGGGSVFAGQRADAFFGDIGAVFDLVAIRKGTGNAGGGKDFFAGYNVHAIALQIPIASVDTPTHTIGVWSSTDRLGQTVRGRVEPGFTQVSRIGNPLVNELLIPTPMKDGWNAASPSHDSRYLGYYTKPVLAGLINKLYKLNAPETGRDDLVQVLLTGIPNVTFTGATKADMLRLNLAVPVTPADRLSRLGVLGGDNQGYPNGRRLQDDVIDISEQAVGGFLKGVKLPLGDGVDAAQLAPMSSFPYEHDPYEGFVDTKGDAPLGGTP